MKTTFDLRPPTSALWLLTAVLCLLTSALPAGVIVVFDPTSFPITNRVTRIIPSANTLDWIGVSNALINPAIPVGVDLKVTNNLVVIFSAADYARIDATNAILAANFITAQRTNEIQQAVNGLFGTNSMSRMDRAIIVGIMNALNNIRTQAAINLPALTTNQIVLAISNNIRLDPR